MKKKIILILLIAIYLIVIFGICIIKYNNNLYNAVDLAIFSQAFESLGQGDFLYVPIQDNQYMADHFSLMFFIFYPFYLLWQSPVFLLFIQTLFIALAAWPLFLISKKYLSENKSLVIAGLYLINPFIISMNLYEFHWLTFSFFFFFWLFYFYLEKKITLFHIFLFLTLFIREDISLLIFGFGIYKLFEQTKSQGFKKAIKSHSVISMIALSIVWFLISWFTIKYFNQEPNKFLTYFGWASSWKTFFYHIFNFNQVVLLLQLFLPFVFIPLLKPRFLLIGLFYYLLMALSYGVPLINLHYGAPLLIPCYLAIIYTLSKNEKKEYKNFYLNIVMKNSLIMLVIIALYLNYFFGPWVDLEYKVKIQGFAIADKKDRR